MGLFTKFKKMFEKNVEIDESCDSELVHLYSMQPASFHIGYNILVRPNFNAVFVIRDRVTDVLPPGKYRLGLEGLPLTFHKLKLDRLTKKGMPKKFKADLYFVNTNAFSDFKFNGDVPYINKTKDFGKVVAYTEGTCTMQVDDAGNLISYLLIDRPYATNKTTQKDCAILIGNYVNKYLEKTNLTIKEIFKNPKQAGEMVSESLDGKLKDYGIMVKNISLKYFDINSRVQKQLSESIGEEKSFVEDYSKISATSEEIEEMEPKFVVENNVDELTQRQEEEVQPHVENYAVPEQHEEDATWQAVEQDVQPRPQLDNPINTPQNIYEKSPTTITCPNCGKYIAGGGHFCPNCGFNLDSLK